MLKGAIACVFLLLFLILKAFQALSGVAVATVVIGCIAFTLHIWMIASCFYPVFKNHSEYISVRLFTFSKTFFALLLLLLSLISLCEQGRSGDFSHSYVESLFLILVAYELFGSYAMYSFYLRLKKEAMHPVRPVVGVE